MEIRYNITVNFVSGIYTIINISEKEWKGIEDNLNKHSWNEVDISNIKFGISFAHVTHYSVDVVEVEDQVTN